LEGKLGGVLGHVDYHENLLPQFLALANALLAEEGGAPVREISEAVGRSSVATTEIYLRAPKGMRNAATDKIAL
jgi:site-specific recombinase XerD